MKTMGFTDVTLQTEVSCHDIGVGTIKNLSAWALHKSEFVALHLKAGEVFTRVKILEWDVKQYTMSYKLTVSIVTNRTVMR